MAMKCVAQMPQPLTAASSAIQIWRVRPCEARARSKRLIATQLARKQTTPASTTSRQSCSVLKQVSTRYILLPQAPSGKPPFAKELPFDPGTIPDDRFNQVNGLGLAGPMVNDCLESIRNLAVETVVLRMLSHPRTRATFCLKAAFAMESASATCQAEKDDGGSHVTEARCSTRDRPQISRFATYLSEGQQACCREDRGGIVKGCTKRSFCPKELYHVEQTAAAASLYTAQSDFAALPGG